MMAKPVSRSFAVLLRSLIFNALYFANLIVHMIAALPTLVLPYPCVRVFIRSYSRTSLWLLRVVCNTAVEWRGVDKLPKGACIVACKHQSAWETFALYAVLDDPAFILKRELMWIPLFGWHMWKAGLIPIDRGAGLAALTRMTTRARQALASSPPRQLVIFPEGTRRTPGAEPDYKPGVAYLYGKTGVPCVPVALNSGVFWPRRSLYRFPGTIVVEILDPIAPSLVTPSLVAPGLVTPSLVTPSLVAPNLAREAFFGRLQTVIETASARLLQEAGSSAPTPNP